MSRTRKQSCEERRIKKQMKDQRKQSEYSYMEHNSRDDRAMRHFRHQAYGKFA